MTFIGGCSTFQVSLRTTHIVDHRISERDAAVRRLRRLTALGLAVAGALSVAFGELAAGAFHGRSSTTKASVTTRTVARRVVATPPPLVSAGSAAQAAASGAAQAPVQSQAPPVVVSGGT